MMVAGGDRQGGGRGPESHARRRSCRGAGAIGSRPTGPTARPSTTGWRSGAPFDAGQDAPGQRRRGRGHEPQAVRRFAAVLRGHRHPLRRRRGQDRCGRLSATTCCAGRNYSESPVLLSAIARRTSSGSAAGRPTWAGTANTSGRWRRPGPMVNGYVAEHFRCRHARQPQGGAAPVHHAALAGQHRRQFPAARSSRTWPTAPAMLDFFGVGMNEMFTENHIDHRDHDRYRALRDVTYCGRFSGGSAARVARRWRRRSPCWSATARSAGTSPASRRTGPAAPCSAPTSARRGSIRTSTGWACGRR